VLQDTGGGADMVGSEKYGWDLETASTAYADPYFEGGATMLNALFGIQATRESWEPHVDTLLIRGLPYGFQLRSLLQSLADPMQQIYVIEQLIGMGGQLKTYDSPFIPLAFIIEKGKPAALHDELQVCSPLTRLLYL
jgi:hypothetical protein